ncbi:MAG: hypothetical protein RR576_11840, partial [Oscillospiraceae bacterium]
FRKGAIMIFTIPFRLPGLNEYTKACRGNKYAGAKFKSDIEDSILWLLKAQRWKITKPIHITFIWHEATRRRDKDNVAFAKKFILDALQKSGKLPNDNNDYIDSFADDFVYGKGDSVVVEIMEK